MKMNGRIFAFALCAAAVMPGCTQTAARQGTGQGVVEDVRQRGMDPQGGRAQGSGSATGTSQTAGITSVDTSLLVSADDDISRVAFAQTVNIDLSALRAGADGSRNLAIAESATAVADGVTARKQTAADGSTYVTVDCSTAKGAVQFVITGTLTNGELEFVPAKGASIALRLSGATIQSGNYPAINVSKAAKTFVVLEGSSALVDGRQYGTGYSAAQGTDYYTASFTGAKDSGAELTQRWAAGSDTKATLYTKGALLISGGGSLAVTESYKHGLYAKDYIRIFGGTVTVQNGGRSAIRSQNGFVMDGGTVTIRGTATHSAHPNDDSRGIIVEGDEGADGTGKGYILITGGTLDITTTGKAISAKWDIDDDAETTDTSDDPDPVVMITGGTVTIRTTDSVVDSDMRARSITYYDVDGIKVTETEKCSPEGIEGKRGVIVTGGTISVSTTDDALNASQDGLGFVNIFGGNLYLYATQADAIDSNGDITIAGGTVVAIAPMGSEDGFDCDGLLSFTGGLAAGISGSSRAYASAGNKSNTQTVFVLGRTYAGTGGTTMAIKDEKGAVVFAFEIPKGLSSYGILTLSAPDLAAGQTYGVYSGVTARGGTQFNGLYTTLPTVSGGSKTTDMATTTGTTVYMAGASEGFGGPGGFGGGRFGGQNGAPGDMPPGDQGFGGGRGGRPGFSDGTPPAGMPQNQRGGNNRRQTVPGGTQI